MKGSRWVMLTLSESSSRCMQCGCVFATHITVHIMLSRTSPWLCNGEQASCLRRAALESRIVSQHPSRLKFCRSTYRQDNKDAADDGGIVVRWVSQTSRATPNFFNITSLLFIIYIHLSRCTLRRRNCHYPRLSPLVLCPSSAYPAPCIVRPFAALACLPI